MDLTIVRHGEKTTPYRLTNIARVLFQCLTFGWVMLLCLRCWSLVAVLYICLLFYWISYLGSGMTRLHKELTSRSQGASYTSLLRLSFSNPKIRFFYKMLYMALAIMLFKVVGSFVCSMNYIKLSSEPQFRKNLMIDLTVSTDEKNFTFFTLFLNVYDEIVLLIMLMIILHLEPAVTPFSKELIDHYVRYFGFKIEFLLSFLQCLSLFIIPVVAKSPLTMVPLIGLVISLILIYYYKKSWSSVLVFPEVFLSLSLIAYMLFRTKTIGQNWLKSLGQHICDYHLPPNIDVWNTVYIGIGILAMLFFRLYRWTVLVQEIAHLKELEEKRLSRGLYLPRHPSKIEVVGDNSQEEENLVTTPKALSQEEAPATKVFDFERPKQTEDKQEQTNDLFESYFCKNFDTILKINKIEALDIDRQIKDPLILELKDYINLERLQEKWGATKVITFKEKCLKQLRRLKKWIYKIIDLVFVKILFSFCKNFLTNQYIVIFFETILAVFYVVYSEPQYTIYPLILWLFFNIYCKFDSGLALNLKIWLLMVPSAINCLMAKKSSSSTNKNSRNQDFNFESSYQYKIFDLSTIGIGIMVLVIVEMIILTWKRKSKEASDLIEENTKSGKKTINGAELTNKIFKSAVVFMISNSLYIIIINIYLIALDINVINLVLLLYFIKLIWSRAFTKKTLYTLFWYNQICILVRYVNSHIWGSENSSDLKKLIGLDESNLFSPQVRLLLNFSLQIMLTFIIFTFRNEALFKKLKAETSRAKARLSLSVNSFEESLINLKDFGAYLVFHGVPWLSYLAIFLALLTGSPSLISVFELLYLSGLLVRHVRLAIEHPYGAFDQIKASWQGMLTLSAFMALGRYLLWFLLQDWFVNSFIWAKKIQQLVKNRLSYLGLIPDKWADAYFDLLPSFLAMYFASIIIERANMVAFAVKNSDSIGELSKEILKQRRAESEGNSLKNAPDGEDLEQNDEIEEGDEASEARPKGFTLFKVDPKAVDSIVPLIDKDEESKSQMSANKPSLMRANSIDETQTRVKKLKALKLVFGWIHYLRDVDKPTVYLSMKTILCFNFLLTVWLSVSFRVGLFMFGFLLLNLQYFWRSHSAFFNKAEESGLDHKIIGRLKAFYRNFLSKKGVMSENKKKYQEVMNNEMKVKLMAFTFLIRYNDIKLRAKFYKAFPVLIALLFITSYASMFLVRLSDFKMIQKWLNVTSMMTGALIHSDKAFWDVYGYLILFLLYVLELTLARKLKKLMKSTGIADISSELKSNKLSESETSQRQTVVLAPFRSVFKRHLVDPTEYVSDELPKDSFILQVGFSAKTRPIPSEIEYFGGYEEDTDYLKEVHQKRNVEEEESDSEEESGSNHKSDKGEVSLRDRNTLQVELTPDEPLSSSNILLSKLLYYFFNKALYLNCKMYLGGIFLMLRGAFLIGICVSDSTDCIISILVLIYIAYLWYKYIEEPQLSVKSLNKALIFSILIKYLIGCLDIQSYSGDKIEGFEPSLVLQFLGNRENKNYYYFELLIGKSLTSGWLFVECLVFISIQILVYLYTVILRVNTDIVGRYIEEVGFMVQNFIKKKKIFSAATVLAGEAQKFKESSSNLIYLNFSKWMTPGMKIVEMYLKMGSVYLPIITILILLGFSHSNASLPILFIVMLGVWLIYHLIFNWMYSLLDQRKIISKNLGWIKLLIWGYLILGSITRTFEKIIKEIWPQFVGLTSASLIIAGCLAAFQIITDLWASEDFQRFYKEFLASNKLSQLVIPLCEAYDFNEEKLRLMINNLKSKEALEQRIQIMEKQLKIWHYKFSGKEGDTDENKELKEDIEQWEKEIEELDKEEENMILELRYKENLVSKVSIVNRFVNYIYIVFMKQINRYRSSPFLYLMSYVKSKNTTICDRVDFKIYDYISEDYQEYISILEAIKGFYEDRDEIKKNLKILHDENEQKLSLGRASQETSEQPEESNKDPEKLSQASDIIARRLKVNKKSIKIDYTKLSGDQKTLMFYDTTVGGVPIRFYNIMDGSDQTNQTDLNLMYRYSNRRKLKDILTSIPRYVLANFQGITLGVLILYCLMNPYPLKLLLLVYILLHGLVEENNLTRKFWRNIFILLAFISILKLSVKSIFVLQIPGQDIPASTSITLQSQDIPTTGLIQPSQALKGVIEFVFGTMKTEAMEVIAFLFAVLRVLRAQIEGTFNKYYTEVENVSEAYIRLKLNNKLDDIWVKDYKLKTDYVDLLQKIVLGTKKKRIQKFDFKAKPTLDQNEEILYDISLENLKARDHELQNQILNLIQSRMEQSYFDFPTQNIQDDNWRVFSKYNRKTGIDLYVFAAIVQILMLLFIFLFYKQMEEPVFSGSDALESLKGEQFSGWMTIFLFIQVGFIVWERKLFLLNTKKWNDWETFKKSKLDEKDPRFFLLKRVGKKLDGLTPHQKFVAVAKRIRFLISLYNIEAKELSELLIAANKTDEKETIIENQKKSDYMYNPLLKRLKFLKFLMLFFYATMFFYFPFLGNKKTSGSIFCNSAFFPVYKQQCNHVTENKYIHMFFILTTIYFILCSLQIKHGESFLKNQKKKNRNWTKTEKITNLIVTKVPFVFEIKTALDFAVTKTSLGLFEWFKFEDIYNTFFAAKYAQIASDMRRLGTARATFEKVLFGWLAMIIFLVIVLAPIFIFSNFNPDSVINEIKSLETTLGIQLGLSKFQLYSNENPKEIRNLTIDEFQKTILPYTNKLNYETNTIQKISLYPFGDSTWSITTDMYRELEKLLLDSLTQQKTAKLYLTIKMSQKSSKTTIYTVEKQISPQVVLLMQEMLSKCNGEKILVPDFYFQFLKINPTTGIEKFPTSDNQNFTQTLSLQAQCMSTKTSTSSGVKEPTVKFWSVAIHNKTSDDENQKKSGSSKTSSDGSEDNPNPVTANGLYFYMVLDKYSKSLSMFSSVIAMYTGFVLIIGNVIKGIFTGQTTKLWTSDVPKAEQIIRICEGVTAARIEGDTLREEILYWELVDIMRSPEMVKLISQNYLEHKKKIEKIHEKTQTK